MEEKKFDPYQFIGFILIAMILTWMLYRNGPQEVPAEAKAATEQIVTPPEEVIVQDSIQQQQKVLAYGDLGALFMPNTLSNTVLSTEDMNLELQSKGGGISKLQLKEFENYKNFGLEIGFEVVESGALVRSSYHADEQARLIAKRSDKVV